MPQGKITLRIAWELVGPKAQSVWPDPLGAGRYATRSAVSRRERREGIQMTRIFLAWLASLLMIALFALVSVRWLDKPIALWVRAVFASPRKVVELAGSPFFSIPLVSAAVFVILGLLTIMGREFSKLAKAVLLCNISVLDADTIKN
jgi:hypothetical protein